MTSLGLDFLLKCTLYPRAKLADSATELVDLPAPLSPGHVFTILNVPYRHRTV